MTWVLVGRSRRIRKGGSKAFPTFQLLLLTLAFFLALIQAKPPVHLFLLNGLISGLIQWLCQGRTHVAGKETTMLAHRITEVEAFRLEVVPLSFFLRLSVWSVRRQLSPLTAKRVFAIVDLKQPLHPGYHISVKYPFLYRCVLHDCGQRKRSSVQPCRSRYQLCPLIDLSGPGVLARRFF